jgi:hypothetical protein
MFTYYCAVRELRENWRVLRWPSWTISSTILPPMQHLLWLLPGCKGGALARPPCTQAVLICGFSAEGRSAVARRIRVQHQGCGTSSCRHDSKENPTQYKPRGRTKARKTARYPEQLEIAGGCVTRMCVRLLCLQIAKLRALRNTGETHVHSKHTDYRTTITLYKRMMDCAAKRKACARPGGNAAFAAM